MFNLFGKKEEKNNIAWKRYNNDVTCSRKFVNSPPIKERKVNMRGYLSKEIAIEILFIFPFAILPALLGYYGGLLALILMPLSLLLREKLEGSYKIYSDKKLLFNFIIVYSILLMNVFFTAFGLYKNLGLNDEYVKNIIKIICLTLSLILLKISRFSIKNFKWNICQSHILGTLAIGLMFACITIFFDGFIFINRFNGDIVNYGFYILKTVILVAFFEEFLCRGILISALKGYQISECKANIIQALLFGSLHCVRYLDKGIGVALLITCYQTVIGYFFGKLYLKTKSLTPVILIHLLWDIL